MEVVEHETPPFEPQLEMRRAAVGAAAGLLSFRPVFRGVWFLRGLFQFG